MSSLNKELQKPIRLEYFLGYKLNEIENIILNIDRYYYEKKEKKKNGKYRILSPSINPLKQIQSAIKKNILSKMDYADFLQGGIKKKDNISNAVIHLGKKHHFCTDLKQFFPSITSKQVYRMFIDNGFSSDVSRILTRLTTYKFRLPQGTPTSPHVANLVFMPLGNKLMEICEEREITFTSFIDDLTFSSQRDFQDITPQIIDLIENYGFQISHQKTFYKLGTATITGVETKNNVLNIRKNQMKKINDSSLSELSREGLINYRTRVKNKGCS